MPFSKFKISNQQFQPPWLKVSVNQLLAGRGFLRREIVGRKENHRGL
jgi:hypothetical protein